MADAKASGEAMMREMHGCMTELLDQGVHESAEILVRYLVLEPNRTSRGGKPETKPRSLSFSSKRETTEVC